MQPCAEPGCPVLVPTGYCPTHARDIERARPNVDVRRWYGTARWRQLRARVLVAAHYVCADCGRVAVDLEVDHIVPHRGVRALFWARSNVQALCSSCHAIKTNRGE